MAITDAELRQLDLLYKRFLKEEDPFIRQGHYREYCSATAVFEWRKREAKRKEKAA